MRRNLNRQLDRRAALICMVVAQSNGNPDVDIETFMPKTEAEIHEARQARFLAWVDKAVARTAADEGSHTA